MRRKLTSVPPSLLPSRLSSSALLFLPHHQSFAYQTSRVFDLKTRHTQPGCLAGEMEQSLPLPTRERILYISDSVLISERSACCASEKYADGWWEHLIDCDLGLASWTQLEFCGFKFSRAVHVPHHSPTFASVTGKKSAHMRGSSLDEHMSTEAISSLKKPSSRHDRRARHHQIQLRHYAEEYRWHWQPILSCSWQLNGAFTRLKEGAAYAETTSFD